METDRERRPKLRPGIDVGRFPRTSAGMVTLYDSGGLSSAAVSVSRAALWFIGRFTGSHTLQDIAQEFLRETGQLIENGTLERLVDQLDRCLFLESPAFEAHYAALVKQYRSLPARPSLPMGLPEDPRALKAMLDEILADTDVVEHDATVVGLIAPHLDYTRGRPCYASAYAQVAQRPAPRRIVILGTNHSPRTFVPVATGRDYTTPLGQTHTDLAFIERIEQRCGDLRRCEFDHVREHSVELQLVWCQHLFGADRFDVVPVICPDPDTTADAFPFAQETATVFDFADALRDVLGEDDRDTLVIAAADLSHVGQAFGDQQPLREEFLAEIREHDRVALDHVGTNDPDAFLHHFKSAGNPTKVCSVGCIYSLMKALPAARATILRYHQAVTQEAHTGVTCAAAVFRQ
jgi:AmmeMemoRadiSam system protein B